MLPWAKAFLGPHRAAEILDWAGLGLTVDVLLLQPCIIQGGKIQMARSMCCHPRRTWLGSWCKPLAGGISFSKLKWTDATKHALKPTVDLLQIERWSIRSCLLGMVRGLSPHRFFPSKLRFKWHVAGVGAGAASDRHETARGGGMLPGGCSCGSSFRSWAWQGP